ncbi:hypothetical protein Hypma_013580 [Hypsizygus marmoreus]|uniref:Uncharacterized protein n=1 Tax=Hypsizygus marmoreus TaxID=39966 RepID=A0A369JE30_HYPMA|nr:hypothetical protein Hypma_013580 [Hypsizygus marmoreus]
MVEEQHEVLVDRLLDHCTVNIYFLITKSQNAIFCNGHQIFATPRHGNILHITLSAYCILAMVCTESPVGYRKSDVGPGHGCRVHDVHYVDR